MDSIFIEGMVIMARVGVTKEEREKRRNIKIDVAIQADLTLAMESDSIADTVNYATIKKEIERMAEVEEFCLLERIGSRLASWVLENFQAALAVTVTVRKPDLWRSGVPGVKVTRFRAFKSNVT